MAKSVVVKKRCCRSAPRCKRCPVVLERLARAGLAERDGRRSYAMNPALRKKDLKRARDR